MRIEYARAGMVLDRDVVDENGNLLLEKGITLTEIYLSRLKRLGINAIAIKFPELIGIDLPPPAISPEVRMELSLCFRALFTMTTECILTSKLQTMYFNQITKASDSVISELEKNMPRILNIRLRELTEDETSHAVNVCLLSLVTGLYLKLPRPALKELALGALLHDLGKSVIPQVDSKPLNSPNMHTLYGRDLLLKHQLSSTIARIAAEHHEFHDGSGYPLGLSKKATHPLSRIVAIANYYDNALTQAQLDGTPLQDIIETMLASSDILFDNNTLRAFLHTTPIYPLGSMVVLNTGQTAYVTENRSRYPLRPLVRVFSKTGYEDIDLAHQPNLTIIDNVEE